MITNLHLDGSEGGLQRRSLWKTPALVSALSVSSLLVASRCVDGWNWHPGAFAVVGALVFGLGFAYELVTRNRGTTAYRAGVGMALASGFFLMWGNFVQMADVNPAAAMYFGVPLVGMIGAALARLRPTGMARALFVTAAVQATVLGVVLVMMVTRNPRVVTWTPPELRGVSGNAVFVMLFAASAWLFRRAAVGGKRIPDRAAAS